MLRNGTIEMVRLIMITNTCRAVTHLHEGVREREKEFMLSLSRALVHDFSPTLHRHAAYCYVPLAGEKRTKTVEIF